MGLQTVEFKDSDTRIPRLGLIYFTCGDWTPPEKQNNENNENGENGQENGENNGQENGGNGENGEGTTDENG